MKKSNIRVCRYASPNRWEACIEPEDRSWVLYVPQPEAAAEGVGPQLWHLIGTCEDEHGDTHDAYALDGSPEHQAYLGALKAA